MTARGCTHPVMDIETGLCTDCGAPIDCPRILDFAVAAPVAPAVASMCKPCGGLDATPDTVLAVRGTCAICGVYGRVYRCPARPLPGITRQEASR